MAVPKVLYKSPFVRTESRLIPNLGSPADLLPSRNELPSLQFLLFFSLTSKDFYFYSSFYGRCSILPCSCP